MIIKIYQVDAFADRVFKGNPAAVLPLGERWLEDSIMQNIAMENNLPETAFYINENNSYHIRWFTPEVEVDLCGHATLGAAHVIFNHENYKGDELSFQSRSGVLKVGRADGILTLDFPADDFMGTVMTGELRDCFNFEPVKIFKGKTDYMLVYEDEEQIKNIGYNLTAINRINARGIIVTAPGKSCDFVSRFFAPQSGIPEDPVTGSAHTTLVPYWSAVLDKDELTARQLSQRGGDLICRNMGERIKISGRCVTYMEGEIFL
jgi:PhzF family phenazine biosynthesis protein